MKVVQSNTEETQTEKREISFRKNIVHHKVLN